MIKIKCRELFCIPKPVTKPWKSKLFLTWGAIEVPNPSGSYCSCRHQKESIPEICWHSDNIREDVLCNYLT